jgi:alkanesulfonate monooxygenase SsuD/methylene tetrahydromethanopterin reductase-like flavin-dependent oxidoreductase (luciferase family)
MSQSPKAMLTDHPWVAERKTGPRFGVNISAMSDWRQIRANAKRLEAAGFDSIFLPDHPLLMGDAWTTLAAIAERPSGSGSGRWSAAWPTTIP